MGEWGTSTLSGEIQIHAGKYLEVMQVGVGEGPPPAPPPPPRYWQGENLCWVLSPVGI